MTLRCSGGHRGLLARLILVTMVAAGCGSSPAGTGGALAGSWSSQNARFSADPRSATFTMACEQAAFGPLVPDASGQFAATSTTFTQTGNVIYNPGDKLQIQGRLNGSQLTLQLYVIRTAPPVSDPIVLTLTAGGDPDIAVCTA